MCFSHLHPIEYHTAGMFGGTTVWQNWSINVLVKTLGSHKCSLFAYTTLLTMTHSSEIAWSCLLVEQFYTFILMGAPFSGGTDSIYTCYQWWKYLWWKWKMWCLWATVEYELIRIAKVWMVLVWGNHVHLSNIPSPQLNIPATQYVLFQIWRSFIRVHTGPLQ